MKIVTALGSFSLPPTTSDWSDQKFLPPPGGIYSNQDLKIRDLQMPIFEVLRLKQFKSNFSYQDLDWRIEI